MNSLVPRKTAEKILFIILGTLIYAVGIGLFLDPNSLAPGGVVGISVILSHTVGLATGTWYFILNIPLVIIGFWKFGGRFISYTFIAILCNSVFTNLFAEFPKVTDNMLIAAVAGGVLVGTGLGIVLRSGATTGGMDIVVKVLRGKHPEIKTGTLFIIVDAMVVVISGIVFGQFDLAMYAFIALAIDGRVMDYVLYGGDEARLIYIVSDKPAELLSHILQDIDVGATVIDGKGAYSSRHKDIIMCVVKKRRAPRLQELIKSCDPEAFMVITSANEIYGKGYKNIRSEAL